MAAIVTGADSGIGRACAVTPARRNHDVGITHSRGADGANATNSVAPGEIATPMTGQEDEDPRARQRAAGHPLGRPGDAREVAELVAYLASPEAGYTTGASYVVDGGMLLMAAEANRLATG
jgi:NAD(P)-dependent dehydrogenase (short-subunit alcohol dehydrogenase family)